MNRKFTQEIKDKWIAALESGDYVQTITMLKKDVLGKDARHC